MALSRSQAFQAIHPEFITLWKEGLQPLEIAAALGLSLPAVQAHALRAYKEGVVPPPAGYVVVPAKNLPKIVKEHFPDFSGDRLLRVEQEGEGLVITLLHFEQRMSVGNACSE